METNELLIHLIKERDSFYRRGLELAHNKCQSDSIQEISGAFAKAQAKFEPVTKNKQGYGYKYSTLENLLDMVRPILNANGLTISQHTDEYGVLATRLRHTSGEWFESRHRMKEVEGDNKRSPEQAYGSQMTYMRRYQILALLGVQPESEDNDGAKQ